MLQVKISIGHKDDKTQSKQILGLFAKCFCEMLLNFNGSQHRPGWQAIF